MIDSPFAPQQAHLKTVFKGLDPCNHEFLDKGIIWDKSAKRELNVLVTRLKQNVQSEESSR